MVKEPFYKSVDNLGFFKLKMKQATLISTLVFLAVNYEKSVISNFLSKRKTSLS